MMRTPLNLQPIVWAFVLFGLLVRVSPAKAAVAPPLGQVGSFAVFAGTSVVSIGPTVLSGDLGVYPGAVITGFPPGTVTNGAVFAADATSQQAALDATAAYNALIVQPCDADLSGQDLGGMTLPAGVYCFASSVILTGSLTLDASGDPNAAFVFKIGSTLGSAVGASVNVINGGSNCNVFWQVGSSATIGTSTSFVGNIVALVSITLNTGSSVAGRVVARNGTVSLASNAVTVCPSCGTIAVSPEALPDAKVSVSYNQVIAASGGTAPYSYVVSAGALPPGITLADTGALVGTPTLANSFNFTLQATDSSGCIGTRSYTLLVNPSGGSSGEPHVRTLDGLAYDFQACGDFVLLTTPGRELEVQVRQKSWPSNRLTSVNTQLAIKHGVHRLVIATIGSDCKSTPELPDACVRANGQVVQFACAEPGDKPGCPRSAVLGDGTRVDEVQHVLDPGECGSLTASDACLVQYVVTLPTGEAVMACLQHGYLNVRAAVNTTLHPVSGLLGNADGNPSNDLQLRGGGHLAVVPGPNHTDFYAIFGESWRVPLADALLGPDPEPTHLCASKSFTAADLDDHSRNRAAQTCARLAVAPESMQDCVLDVAVLGDIAALAFVGLLPPREVLVFRQVVPTVAPEVLPTDCGDDCGVNGTISGFSGCSQGGPSGGAGRMAALGLLAAAWRLVRVRSQRT